MQASGTTTSEQPPPKERKRNPFTSSAGGGRALSAMMLPLFMTRPPRGFGVLTTTGRRTGKRRRKCVRVIRRDDQAYLVMLGPALLGKPGPKATAAWLLNIRADPRVRLRMRGGTFAGAAREIEAPSDEQHQARATYCESVNAFDYLECNFHIGGRPTRAKIERMHGHWFDTGIPLVIDLAR
jgi:deazaflavin-dependent oxidoreductase (nitroreductase family)